MERQGNQTEASCFSFSLGCLDQIKLVSIGCLYHQIDAKNGTGKYAQLSSEITSTPGVTSSTADRLRQDPKLHNDLFHHGPKLMAWLDKKHGEPSNQSFPATQRLERLPPLGAPLNPGLEVIEIAEEIIGGLCIDANSDYPTTLVA